MTGIQMVDAALDGYVQAMGQRGIDPKGVQNKTLAHLAGVTTWTMSMLLQEYRTAQKKPNTTKYVIGAEGYGRAASWRILAKPNSDPKVVRDARREHGAYVARDALVRYISDRVHEVNPALTQSAVDKMIEKCSNLVQQQFESTIQFIESVLVP